MSQSELALEDQRDPRKRYDQRMVALLQEVQRSLRKRSEEGKTNMSGFNIKRTDLAKLLDSPEVNEGERSLLLNLTNRPREGQDGFESALWRAIRLADQDNLLLLQRGFPEHVGAWVAYHQTGSFVWKMERILGS